jgi:LacI family gluconate utilization system Gnt-I transcriptional repressor
MKRTQTMTKKSPKRPVTMAEVAARAGVSAMTVSRALRSDGEVSEETRRRILTAVEELGYVLDLSAGALSSKRTGFVAVLIPSINNSNFSDTARGITEAIENQGLQILLGYTEYDMEKEEQLVQAMLTRRPDGIIITDGRHTPKARRMLQSAGIPVVETWDLPADPIDHVVGFSNVEASRALVHRLYHQGYRNIAFIGGASRRDTRGADRRLGYKPCRCRARPATGTHHIVWQPTDLDGTGRRGHRPPHRAVAGCGCSCLRLRPVCLRRDHGVPPSRLGGTQSDRDCRLR